ncbi:hypothetical protein F5B20DRAFT_585846 [Whalleya microplaca]|nr:hypothetical protein F5B20DRAFT_585846 [Whalleya microplaca]
MPSDNIDAWVAAQKKLPRAPTDEELAVFREFLDAPSNDVWKYAQRIASFYIKPFEESRVDIFWFVLGDAVNRLVSQNDKLADLVLELQRLPDGKGILGPDPWWSDLPYFNNFWTEWMQFRFDDLSQSHPDLEANSQANVNRNAFLAKLTARMGKVIDLDQRERGGETLKQALEQTQISNTNSLAGWTESWEYPHNGTNWGIQKGWSKDRWQYWRKRFYDISNMANMKEETRKVAKECAERMEAIENTRD